ncbi:hypothetical protein ACFW1A_34560 [Kitasatospora sp. NPDC058965]|uniref:hypothetical protein n=1 Tax=Kitasatospora sp. NPDC058965 TaxID=3346682 RepID=UPI00369305D3
MDIDAVKTVTEAVSAAAGAAGTAVGKQAWESLVALAKRAYTRAKPGAELAEVDPTNPAEVSVLTGTVLARHDADPELAAELASWLGQYGQVVQTDQRFSTVTNTISGNSERTVQAQTINGSVNF